MDQKLKAFFERAGGLALLLELARFGLAGLIIAGSGILSLFIFVYLFASWYLLASSLSFVVTFIVAFSLQKFWTFRNKEMQRIPAQLSWSIALTIFNFFFNGALMYAFVQGVGLHYLLAQCLTYGAIGVFDFFLYKFVIFKPSGIAPRE